MIGYSPSAAAWFKAVTSSSETAGAKGSPTNRAEPRRSDQGRSVCLPPCLFAADDSAESSAPAMPLESDAVEPGHSRGLREGEPAFGKKTNYPPAI
jgi:hypothetical protein